MKIEIDIDDEVLGEFRMSEAELAQAVKYSVSNMKHPEDGAPCYINHGVRVSVQRGNWPALRGL